MIFVDTAAWFAWAVPWDPDHQRVREWFASNTDPLLTTDFVIDETLTLLRARGENRRALALGDGFFSGEVALIHKVELPTLREAWDVFKKFADKDWSYTDCVSYAVIQSLRITTAVSLDQHFRQFGIVTVRP